MNNTPKLRMGIAAGLAGVLFILVSVLLVRSSMTRSPRPCLTRQVPAYPPPAAWVTAEDYFAQGNYAYDSGDCKLAIADYSQAIALNPNYAEAYNNRAYTYMILQDYAMALPDLDRAIQIRPGYVNALMNRGDIHNFYYAIDYEKAIADYDHVISLGAMHTSVCGHRLLAVNHGWNLHAIGEVLTRGAAAGCPEADNVQ
jgi:tetratricopeptide (TPR) repeat protein